eukprot:CAMPEP_0168623420 /NCGR_PEP_ID=MMETSP0449_2-20121227/8816_1 /TAXON_ID=1082188 /ORGANISM="Strombidium rassoulzadegani, Strain ras09" /LENGTH=121 /DNA_ID=CAMNT_0008664801 /DNA_START=306 /DNA_END=671 /DNA_ORIENTATION=+
MIQTEVFDKSVGKNVSIIEAHPELGVQYIMGYLKIWRGKVVSSVNATEMDRMLLFAEKHFETLRLQDIKGIDLRKILKSLIETLDQEISLRQVGLRERLQDLIARDPSLLVEDEEIESLEN